jgi:geranylgeranyl diphosphate synthase type II
MKNARAERLAEDAWEDMPALAAHIDALLNVQLAVHNDVDGATAVPRIQGAMTYAITAGGKRLRPALVFASAHAASVLTIEEVWAAVGPAVTAVEMVHTYSLIQDDLPAMDDDDLRRGKPTLHLAYDEATAILAGDALLTDAFAVLATAPKNAAAQVRELALAAGSAGMISGQSLDLQNLGDEAPVDADSVDLADIHRRKTGRLFAAACVLGGLAVDAPPVALERLRRFGHALGLAFQIADDILDVTSTSAEAGKPTGRDAERNKISYPSRYGLEAARHMARAAAERAVLEVEPWQPRASLLAALARRSVERSR